MESLVNILSYEYPWEAYVAQGRLAAEGIRSFIFDDGILYANPFLTNAVGGVKLMVHRADVEKSLVILRDILADGDSIPDD